MVVRTKLLLVTMVSKAKSQTVSATGKPSLTNIGIFPFKTYGALIKRELQWFEDQSDLRIDSILLTRTLAQTIAKDHTITEVEAINIVENLGLPENIPYAFQYVEALAEIQKSKYSDSNFSADVATMFIQSRFKKAASLACIAQDLFDYYDIEVDADKGWTAENTEDLPMDVIDKINDFVILEKKRMSKEEMEDDSAEEVTLGK